MDEIKLLESLSKYYIEIGIFTAEGMKTVNIPVISSDTNTSIQMKIADIMYFTEYGTISIPGTFVLEKSLVQINNLLNDEISRITDEILLGNFKNLSDIDSQFEILCFKIENIIQGYMRSMIQNQNVLSRILEKDNENKYLYDLDELSKYIKCRYFTEN